MEPVSHSLVVSDEQIMLSPCRHDYTLVWLVGMGEEPQRALDFLLSREILAVRCFRCSYSDTSAS